jgi:hypothetical protein
MGAADGTGATKPRFSAAAHGAEIFFGIEPQPSRVCVRTNETQAFVWEPGRTEDPSAALGMTKGRVTLP